MFLSFLFSARKSKSVAILFNRPVYKDRSKATLTIGATLWNNLSHSAQQEVLERLKSHGFSGCQKFCRRRMSLTKSNAEALAYYAGLFL